MLTFYASNNRMLPPIVKIKQIFILMQNTYKRNWLGADENFSAAFSKKCQFWPISDVALIF